MYLGGEYGSSVLATDNVMMAASWPRARRSSKRPPANPRSWTWPNSSIKMGAKIKGHGTPIIEIDGVKALTARAYGHPRPDRGGHVYYRRRSSPAAISCQECLPEPPRRVVDKCRMRARLIEGPTATSRVSGKKQLKPINVTTLPYPGFPTDMQAQVMALMTVTPGSA